MRTPLARVYAVSHPRYSHLVKLPRPGRAPLQKWFRNKGEKTGKELADEYAKGLNDTLILEGHAGLSFDATARAEWAACQTKLAAVGATMTEATNFYLSHYVPAAKMTPETAIESFLADCEMRNLRDATIATLRKRLGLLLRRMEIEDISEVTAENVREILRGYKNPKTRMERRNALSQLREYLVKRRIRLHDWMELSPVAKIDVSAPVALTVEEARAFLTEARKYAKGRWLRNVAIRMFAGLRPGEMDELTEAQMRADSISIERGKNRGGRSFRVVPILPPLRRLLDETKGRPLQPGTRTDLAFAEMKQRAGISIQGTRFLRKTWISMRLAQTQDENQTAREAGNSPQMIYDHYWDRRTKAEGEAFFA